RDRKPRVDTMRERMAGHGGLSCVHDRAARLEHGADSSRAVEGDPPAGRPRGRTAPGADTPFALIGRPPTLVSAVVRPPLALVSALVRPLRLVSSSLSAHATGWRDPADAWETGPFRGA